jgi:hypothetical protein
LGSQVGISIDRQSRIRPNTPMDIKTRARNILVAPNEEWSVIAEEQTPASTLVTGYVLPLAAIGAVAGFIGGSIVGMSVPFLGTVRAPITSGLVMAVFMLVMAVVGVFVVSFIINALAPTFGAQKNSAQAFKVAVYSYTPAWIAGVFQIIPALGILGFFAALYGFYLLYLGLPRLMQSPKDKAAGYTAVVVVCMVVFYFVVMGVGGLIVGGAAMSGLALGGAVEQRQQFDPNSPMGKLESLGRSLEESGKKMEAAQKSGDANAQATAAMEGLGALLGGGKRVEPVALNQLTLFIPDTFAGLAKKSSNSERTGMAGIMVATAEAGYGEGDKSATLEITDTGGASGLMGLAGWVGVEGEKENDQVSERTERVGGRLVHQRASKTGGQNEFAIVLGDRFIVTAKGHGIDVNTLRGAVSSLDLSKLESMKAVGVSK